MQFAHLRHPEPIDGNMVDKDTVERIRKWQTMFLECLSHNQLVRRATAIVVVKEAAPQAENDRTCPSLTHMWADRTDRQEQKLACRRGSRKSRLQTALISLQNGLVRSQYLLAAKVQAYAGPQSV